MLDEMANHAARVQRIADRYGYDVVEDFIDTCLSLENLIDYHAPYIKRPEAQSHQPIVDNDEEPTVEGLKVEREYMQPYINPPEFLEQQRKRMEEERQKQKRFPENPQRDILLFLLNYAPLERWQHALLEIVRNEAYYFAPQGMTKILNEGWACLVSGSLLPTTRGLLPIDEIVHQRLDVSVSDGDDLRRVYDWMSFENRNTVHLRTTSGLEVEGSTTHRVMMADGTWRRLDACQVGDTLRLSGGSNLWAQEYVTIGEVSDSSGSPFRAPTVLDEPFAAFLGHLTGSGTINETAHTISIFAADETHATHVANLVRDVFGIAAHTERQPSGWQLHVSSHGGVEAVLNLLGVSLAGSANTRTIPPAILRSPKPVVVAFLRALYDSTGIANHEQVTLFTASDALGKTVQVLLLNLGIRSSRQMLDNGHWHIDTTGLSAARFKQEIGSGLPDKQALLQQLTPRHHGFISEDWTDTIAEITYRQADVYDISVATTHRYVAQGFINHNSFWHSEMMTKKVLDSSEIISFADLHSGVVATSGARLNPYKLGLELLRDVEDRWNKGKFGKEYEDCDDILQKRMWDKQLGLGRQKIFEIRQLYNDVTFIDEFLTPEFVLENKLFSFKYNRDTDLYEIASREFKEVKEKLLFRLTNFGQPFIYIEDANYNNRGELYLKHRHEGVDLKMDYARDTLRNLYKLWTRPVHLETMIDGRRRLITLDGREISERKTDG
jgi:stage V sporulation protein R